MLHATCDPVRAFLCLSRFHSGPHIHRVSSHISTLYAPQFVITASYLVLSALTLYSSWPHITTFRGCRVAARDNVSVPILFTSGLFLLTHLHYRCSPLLSTLTDFADTGDRPYKCVHCGDQFARSDLLSRHVNKCHAGEKGASASGGGTAGRRKGTSTAARATTSKQACDQCVQSSLPCDGSNPCSKCISRKTRCTFVKFHRQTAPVGPGHPTSLTATIPSSLGAGPMGGSTSSLSSIGSHHHGHHSPLSLSVAPPHGLDPHTQPYMYAQSGPTYSFPPNGTTSAGSSPTVPFSGMKYADEGRGSEFAYHPGSGFYPNDYRDGYEGYEGSEHSGSVGSRPASSAGLSDYGGYTAHFPNQRHSIDLGRVPDLHQGHPGTDLRELRSHAADLHPAHDVHPPRPPEFSSAFGLMSLDDPQVLAGLAQDGVPFFSGTTSTARTGLTPGSGLTPLAHPDKRLVMPPPMNYSYPSPGGPPPQTPGSREAETRELREFWKTYMRTPLTGPAEGLGMETPSASAAAAIQAGGGMLGCLPTGRRQRVSSLPSVRTPEVETSSWQHHHSQVPLAQPASRTMHNAEDLRSYEAAVLARKAPELTLRKPARRGTTSGQPPDHPVDVGTTSSLAGALVPTGSAPGSPYPGTPNSTTSDDGDGDDGSSSGGGSARPSFKRLPSQTLESLHAKRRKDRPDGSFPGGISATRSIPAAGSLEPAAPAAVATFNSFADRPIIPLRAPAHSTLGQKRNRRLSEPVSPTSAGFLIH
ncbi:unnamed protein product [Mycena citricolor]|uniref:Zn(2)-C6 fungal-type domain-containing protein n=1 Tax=Mycena citricolor TaxID=2018698 RepID=A0AAD2H4M7_9AGAR|nr:unnamed protein product [Mycena citricolor]